MENSDEAGKIVVRASEEKQKTPLGEVLRELQYLTGEDRDDFLFDLALENRWFERKRDAWGEGSVKCEDCKRALDVAMQAKSEFVECPRHDAEHRDLHALVKELEKRLILQERVV